MPPWLDRVQVKWFAWAAEYPQTDIYTPQVQSGAAAEYRPQGAHGGANKEKEYDKDEDQEED
jgi:hypothetical protein